MLLNSYNTTIDLDYDCDEHTRKLVEQYIPDLTLGGKEGYPISISEGDPHYISTSQGVVYQAPEILPSDVKGIVSRHFEYLFAKDGLFSVHSSCVDIDGKTVLVPGRSGSGKTTLLTKLLQTYPDAKVISADRTLIDQNQAVAGTKTLNYVYQCLLDDFPEVADQIRIPSSGKSIKVYPQDSPFNYEYAPSTVDLIVYPQRHAGTFSGRELYEPENLTRLVNQSFHFLNEFPGILIGTQQMIETPVDASIRQRVLDSVVQLSGTSSHAVSGSLDEMVKYVGDVL